MLECRLFYVWIIKYCTYIYFFPNNLVSISNLLQVSSILQKAEVDRTDEEKEMLFSCSEVVKEVTRR